MPPSVQIPSDDLVDIAIIIPTLANPKVLVPAFRRLVEHLDGLRVKIVVVANPRSTVDAIESIDMLAPIWKAAMGRGTIPAGCSYHVLRFSEPLGFGAAINEGFRALVEGAFPVGTGLSPDVGIGLPPISVIFNDDLQVVDGWLLGLLGAFASELVAVWAETPSEIGEDGERRRPRRRMADFAPNGPGIVGPVTNCAAGIQQIAEEGVRRFNEIGIDAFAEEMRSARGATVVAADFLSGFCMAFTRETIEALAFVPADGGRWQLFDERYPVAGYEDNDICARAALAGIRCVVAAGTFVGHIGHQTFDTEFPDHLRGMRNRLAYYDVWDGKIRSGADCVVTAAYRVRLDTWNDLDVWRQSLMAVSRLADNVVVLMTAGMALVRADNDRPKKDQDARLVGECADVLDESSLRAITRWVEGCLAAGPKSRFGGPRGSQVAVAAWTGRFNERDERNALLAMADAANPDWILSVDHDEVVEPRFRRDHLDRLMSHPDPLVQSWDVGFVNHWDSLRLVNQTPPWGDGGTFTGGMHGWRFFRRNPAIPSRVLAGGHNGLHCGNIPLHDPVCKRISSLRFRHLGYLRAEDRQRKQRRYEVQDPTPDILLVGGPNYAHINHEEMQTFSAFSPVNGIGLHMLMYEREDADALARHLDLLHGVVDRVVLVWTGAWDEDDKEWLDVPDDHAMGARRANATRLAVFDGLDGLPPATGPGKDVARIAMHFGAEWLHHPLDNDLAAARNAGIDALDNGDPGMGWAMFWDPDEVLQVGTPLGLRRMAECGDAYGFLVEFANRHADGSYSPSESVRMSRLDPEKLMRMDGRVHETFSEAIRILRERGVGNTLRYAPGRAVNTGLAISPEAMEAKLERYRDMIEISLRENPDNASAWTTLGLYWGNEGCVNTQILCLHRALLCHGSGHVAPMELSNAYARLALAYGEHAVSRMGNHRGRSHARDRVDALAQIAPPQPKHGLVPAGLREPRTDDEATASLPPFPDGGFLTGSEIEKMIGGARPLPLGADRARPG